jgi:predicted porin
MQKNALTIAAALALATFGAGTAFAQSSLTLYGNADVSVDHVKKTAGVPLGCVGLKRCSCDPWSR